MTDSSADEMKRVSKEALAQEIKLQEILKDPLLLLRIIELVQSKGVVGEETTIITLVNKVQMRLVKNREPTSDNLILSDKTGGGKDFVVKKTCEVIVPPKYYKHRTDISDKTFDYWKPITDWYKDEKGKNKPIYESWNGYVIHLEDPREEALNSQSFKVMSSGGTEVTKVINNMAKDISVDGKPTIIVTSLTTMLNLENMRRWDTLRIDTSTEQTQIITKQKLLRACGKVTVLQNEELLQALQTLLFPKVVIIPFAEKLIDILPINLMSRTQTDKLLDAIKSSAVLHQYLRNKIDNTTIEADYFDLLYGWFVFSHLNGSSGVPMSRDEEELVKILIEQPDYVDINKLSELYQTHSKQWLYLRKEELTNKGFIRTKFEWSDYANKEVEKIWYGDGVNVVLKGFNDVLKLTQQEGFNDFNHFNQLIKEINKAREKQGLEPTFDEICLKPRKPEKTKLRQILKPQKNIVKTSQSQEKNNFVPQEDKERHVLEKEQEAPHRMKDNGSFDFCCDTDNLQLAIDLVQEHYDVLTDTVIFDMIKTRVFSDNISDEDLVTFVDIIYEIIIDALGDEK